ncbi:hypothetical protein [Streptomyces sp. bgisy029]|uniref:hypothetical protein n=1 Tax=Streptomyces sp. bgisy029 TaxID=3413771 RepID=UPI003D73E2C9
MITLPLVWGYPLARSARTRARRFFPAQGHRHLQDPQVWRVQKARAWTAAGASLAILIAYGTSEDLAQAQEQYWLRLVITPWLLLLTAPLVVGLLAYWAPSDRRGPMRRSLRPAGRSVLVYFGAFTLIPVFAVAGGWTFQFLKAKVTVSLLDLFAGPPLFMLSFTPALWMLLFVVFASGPALRSAFTIAEIHAALPALLTGVLVWELAAIGLTLGGPPPGPLPVQLLALLGGPASVTALAWWEIHRLRTRYGVTLRG